MVLTDNSHDVPNINNADIFETRSQDHTCKYYEIEDFQSKVEHLSDTFSSLSINVRSLRGNGKNFRN